LVFSAKTSLLRPAEFFSGLRYGESFEEEFQVGLGLDLIGLGGFNQGEQHGAGISALRDSGEEPVLSAQGHNADGDLESLIFTVVSVELSDLMYFERSLSVPMRNNNLIFRRNIYKVYFLHYLARFIYDYLKMFIVRRIQQGQKGGI
jgi:hypothetical protein